MLPVLALSSSLLSSCGYKWVPLHVYHFYMHSTVTLSQLCCLIFPKWSYGRVQNSVSRFCQSLVTLFYLLSRTLSAAQSWVAVIFVCTCVGKSTVHVGCCLGHSPSYFWDRLSHWTWIISWASWLMSSGDLPVSASPVRLHISNSPF